MKYILVFGLALSSASMAAFAGPPEGGVGGPFVTVTDCDTCDSADLYGAKPGKGKKK